MNDSPGCYFLGYNQTIFIGTLVENCPPLSLNISCHFIVKCPIEAKEELLLPLEIKH